MSALRVGQRLYSGAGVRLRDLIALAQPKSEARYVYFQSADGYYESWDLASSLHPQTLMAYQKNGQPLAIEKVHRYD
jgi:DMSO/TMAO reductase YedYZ molybdopterin-dependent catalytic subunit